MGKVLVDDETIIETDLTDEELAIIAEGDRLYIVMLNFTAKLMPFILTRYVDLLK